MKRYGYNDCTTHQAIIFEIGSEADDDSGDVHGPDTQGLIVGSSEWGWIDEDNARRICAALQYFSENTTKEIEAYTDTRFPKPCCDSPGKDKCDQCQEIGLANPLNH